MTEKAHRAEVLGGTIKSTALTAIGFVLGFIFIFMLSRLYGAGAVGLYGISIAALSILGTLSTFGLNIAAVRFSAEYASKGKWGDLKALYGKMISISLALAVTAGALMFALSGPLSAVFLKDPELSLLFKITAVSVPFFALSAINVEALRGLKRLGESETLRSISTAFWNILFFLLLVRAFGFRPGTPVLSFGLAVFVTSLISSYLWMRLLKGKKAPEGPLPSHGKLVSVSGPMFFSTAMHILMSHSDMLILGYFRGAEEAGPYGVAVRVSLIAGYMLSSVSAIAAPKISELYWGKRTAELERVVRFSSKLIFWSSAPLLLALVMFSGPVMEIFGRGFSGGKIALVILALGQFINASTGCVGSFLDMTGGERARRNIVFWAALINISLNIVLVPRMGLTGAAIASAVSLGAGNIWGTLHIKLKYGIETFYLPFSERGTKT